MFGIGMMVLENELSSAKIYTKVSHRVITSELFAVLEITAVLSLPSHESPVSIASDTRRLSTARWM